MIRATSVTSAWSRLTHSYPARLGALGTVAAFAISSCQPQCAPAEPEPARQAAPAVPAPAPQAAPAVPVPAPTPTTVPSGTQFFEDFSSPAALNRFQFQVHRDIQLPPPTEWHGDHAMSCGGPDETRVIDRDVVPDESIYFCAPKGPDSGHFMTSMMTQGYAQIDFSPQQVFTNVSKICWDMNQTEMGGRKWVDVVVIKEATYQANGGKLFYALPGFDVSIAGGGIFFGDQDNFMLSMFEGSTETYNGQIGYPTGNRNDDDGFTTTDKARRYRNCMTDNGNGTISFELERDSGVDGAHPRRIVPRWPSPRHLRRRHLRPVQR